MATQEILVKYRADVSDLTNQLKTVIERMDKLEAESKQSAKGVDVLTKSVDNLGKELKDVPKELSKATPAVKTFAQTATNESNKLRSAIGTIGRDIATSLGLAFSVAAVVNFGKASIDAFLEAEENAARLKFALQEIGDEGANAFERLIQQSERLQRTTVFSDDDIQRAQTFLSTVGLTGAQIETIIPVIADFATATGKDLASATQAVAQGLKGMGREFKVFNIQVDANKTVLENYNEIIRGSAEFTGAAAAATETLTGQLKQQENAVGELQEEVGKELAPAWLAVKEATFQATLAVIEYFKAGGNLALSLFKKTIAETPGAVEEVTKKVQEQTAALIETGATQEEASRQAIRDIRAEIVERLALRIEQARALQNDEDATEAQKRLSLLRLRGVQNELAAIRSLADLQKQRDDENRKALTTEEIRLKKTDDLNRLLLENQARNDSISQSNVQNIEKEIALRKKQADEVKKQTEELEKEAAKQLEALKKLNSDAQKIPPIELKVKFDVEKPDIKVVNDDLIPKPGELELPPPNTTEFNDGIQDAFDKTVVAWFQANEEIIDSTQILVSDISALFAVLTENQLIELQQVTDAKLEALDTEQRAIDEQLDKRRISETEAERRTEALAEERVATQKKAAAEERKIKKRQFEIDKAAAIAQIIINTAQGVTAALTIPPPAGPILAALNAAAGALELAAAAAQVNPYKKGTKGAKKGLALVDEEGTEAILRGKGRLTTLERGDKVLTAPKTKTYGEVLDAMMDGRFEKYVMQKYVAPQLEKQRKISAEKKQNDFAENITKSMVINNMGDGESGFHLKKIRQQGLNFSNAREIGREIAKELKQDPYRS